MFTIFPAVLSILATIAVWFYRIDRATLEEVERELAEKHSETYYPNG